MLLPAAQRLLGLASMGPHAGCGRRRGRGAQSAARTPLADRRGERRAIAGNATSVLASAAARGLGKV